MEAAREILWIVLFANLFGALVGPEENDFDAALQRRALIEEAGERRAGPAHVANGAHEGAAHAVAAALQCGRNRFTFARLNVGQRQLSWLAHQAGDFQHVFFGAQRRHVVMADDVKVFGLGAPVRQLLPVSLMLRWRLRIQERNQHAAFFGFRSAEEREGILREGKRCHSHAAFEHFTPGERI